MTVITTAFRSAGELRLKGLGLADHPMVVVDHPMASRTAPEVKSMAEKAADDIAKALLR